MLKGHHYLLCPAVQRCGEGTPLPLPRPLQCNGILKEPHCPLPLQCSGVLKEPTARCTARAVTLPHYRAHWAVGIL